MFKSIYVQDITWLSPQEVVAVQMFRTSRFRYTSALNKFKEDKILPYHLLLYQDGIRPAGDVSIGFLIMLIFLQKSTEYFSSFFQVGHRSS